MSHLIAAHTKVDAESRINEHTALTYCADTDNATAMIHLVKKCGASVDNETSAHETALTVALKSEKWRKVTDALMNNLNASATLETSAGDSAVSVAFDSDDEDKILKVLRDGKVDVNKYPFTTAERPCSARAPDETALKLSRRFLNSKTQNLRTLT